MNQSPDKIDEGAAPSLASSPKPTSFKPAQTNKQTGRTVVFPVPVILMTFAIYILVFAMHEFNQLQLAPTPKSAMDIWQSVIILALPIMGSGLVAVIMNLLKPNSFSVVFRFLAFILSFAGIIYYLMAIMANIAKQV